MTAHRHLLSRANLLLALLLLAGQFAAMAHAFEHDADASRVQGCASCITVAQLGAAAVMQPVALVLPPPRCDAVVATPAPPASAAVPATRQRGPPARLPTV